MSPTSEPSRLLVWALVLTGVLGSCTPRPRFSDAPAARRIAFAPRGTILDITYLACGGKGPLEIDVTQTDGEQDVEWVVETEDVFGGINTTNHFTVRRAISDEAGLEIGLAEQRDASLTVVVSLKDEDPVVVEGLAISDLDPSKHTLASGEPVEELPIREWEAGDARLEERFGCP